MDKIPKQVIKDPKRQEAGCKGREKYMNKLKEKVLEGISLTQAIMLRAPPPVASPLLPLNLLIYISMALL